MTVSRPDPWGILEKLGVPESWGLGDLLDRITVADPSARGAQLALYSLLALFPLLLALVGLLSFFNLEDHIGTLQNFINEALPSGQAGLVMQEVERIGTRRGWALLITIVLSAYYAGRSAMVFLQAIEKAWDNERSGLRTRLLGSVLALGLLFSVVTFFALLTLASLIFTWASSWGFIPLRLLPLTLLHWPLLFVGFHTTLRVAYRIGAGRRIRRRWFSVGSVLGATFFVGMSRVFAWYISSVTDLGATYGSLGGVIGLLLYLHLCSTVIFVGVEVDAWLQQRSPELAS